MHLLDSLVEMTGHRDHLRLELSVLSTLQHLPHVTQVRALELVSAQGQRWLRPRTWLQQGELVSGDSDFLTPMPLEPVADLPALQVCLDQQAQMAHHRFSARRHVLWLPVWMQEQASSCLEITQSQAFSPHQLDVLTGIFRVYQNYQSLLDYSEKDALTGLLNRKTFDEQLIQFASVAPLPGARLDADSPRQWLGVIDIDHFKQVNDRFGHLFGDEVLILVANLLRSSFQPKDRIFRFGGEEFVVLLRSATLAQAQQAFERFRLAVQEHAFPQVGRITVSLGFTGTTQSSPVDILGQADQALYYAKAHGRNQVCHYDALVQAGQLHQSVAHDVVELF